MSRVTGREFTREARRPRDRQVFRERPQPRVGERREHRRLVTDEHGQPAARTSIPPAQSYLQIERG